MAKNPIVKFEMNDGNIFDYILILHLIPSTIL